MNENKFKWIPFYIELANRLLQYKDNRKKLINKLYAAFDNANIQLPTIDVDENGNSTIPKDIDPFTFFATFNKQLSYKKRSLIVQHIKEEFNLISEAPIIFTGIPVVHNQKAIFFYFDGERGEEDIDNLWSLFEIAIKYSSNKKTSLKEDFIKNYDNLLKQKGIKWNITMGLYWIRPYDYINLDSRNRWFLTTKEFNKEFSIKEKPVNKFFIKEIETFNDEDRVPNGEQYLEICDKFNENIRKNNYEFNSFPELSNIAYVISTKANKEEKEKDDLKDLNLKIQVKGSENKNYWIYSPGEQANKFDKFYKDKVMGIGFSELGDLRKFKSKEDIQEALQKIHPYYKKNGKFTNVRLALWQWANEIKKGDIIFAKKGTKKIIGYGIVESEYFYDTSYDEHFPHLIKIDWREKGNYKLNKQIHRKTLTNITNRTKDIDIIKNLFKNYDERITEHQHEYSEEDFLNEVYMSRKNYFILKEILLNKKNLIVQGAPGVGKTFLAKRLAYSILGEKDTDKVMMVQFHQSYSYEDFVMGYRPTKKGFELQPGSFYIFCKKAEKDNKNKYFFIIDEINRGNISKIFGELFMLIENDKRGNKNKIRLLYSDETFYIPKNLYIIGLMNTADRSLAIIDYALRRRFSFFDLKPGFSSEGFKKYQEKLESSSFNKLINVMGELNLEIKEDETLGEGFLIGHSYFCNLKDEEKLNIIVEYEIVPLLKEYWFDEPEKVKDWSERLRNSLL